MPEAPPSRDAADDPEIALRHPHPGFDAEIAGGGAHLRHHIERDRGMFEIDPGKVIADGRGHADDVDVARGADAERAACLAAMQAIEHRTSRRGFPHQHHFLPGNGASRSHPRLDASPRL